MYIYKHNIWMCVYECVVILYTNILYCMSQSTTLCIYTYTYKWILRYVYACINEYYDATLCICNCKYKWILIFVYVHTHIHISEYSDMYMHA